MDLELNPFESLFASKDLMPTRRRPSGAAEGGGAETSSKSTILSQNTSSSSGSSAKTPALDASDKGGDAAAYAEYEALNGNNKHNLRIQNLPTLSKERLPGLSLPMFTQDGRRLPPIQLLPGAAMASPGTPSLWNSLLSATNGGNIVQGAPEQGGQYTQANFSQFANLMRKLGLTPNESNLRSGFTPGVGNHTFNFNIATPGGLSNGQMTPGLQSLLGLATGNAPPPVEGNPEAHGFTLPYPPQQAQPEQPREKAPAMPITKEEPAGVAESKPEIVTDHIDDKPVSVKHESPEASDTAAKKKAKTGSGKAKTTKKEEPKKLAKVSEDDKRKQFLERNRVAASKCRQRKKQLMSKMESELAYYSNGFREMSVQVTQLRDQLMAVRNVLMNHKDCPTLVNSVGGFQQLQNILGQSEFVAQVASNAQPNFTSIPSTIPTTLHAAQASEREPVGPAPVEHAMPRAMPQQHQNVGYQEHMAMNGAVPRNYSQTDLAPGMDPTMGKADGLRPVSSTSNLQEQKMGNVPKYGLKAVASMADMQPKQAPVHKLFEL